MSTTRPPSTPASKSGAGRLGHSPICRRARSKRRKTSVGARRAGCGSASPSRAAPYRRPRRAEAEREKSPHAPERTAVGHQRAAQRPAVGRRRGRERIARAEARSRRRRTFRAAPGPARTASIRSRAASVVGATARSPGARAPCATRRRPAPAMPRDLLSEPAAARTEPDRGGQQGHHDPRPRPPGPQARRRPLTRRDPASASSARGIDGALPSRGAIALRPEALAAASAAASSSGGRSAGALAGAGRRRPSRSR